ncbi:hypothetical protein D3C86_1802700 [compost metagenome]
MIEQLAYGVLRSITGKLEMHRLQARIHPVAAERKDMAGGGTDIFRGLVVKAGQKTGSGGGGALS